VWEAPPDVLAAPEMPVDDVVADLDERGAGHALAAPSAAPEPVPAHPVVAAATSSEPASQVQPSPAAAKDAAAAELVPPASAPPAEPITTVQVESGPPPAGARPNGAHPVAPETPERVVFPVEHAPDDPGPDKETEAKPRFRLFG
jgi:HemY protein